jgi:predicted transposase/invertase (TIGR01784 family)
LEDFDQIPQILNEPIFQKAFETATLANMTAAQRDSYEMSLMQYRDLKSVMETAVEEAVEKAVEKAVIETIELRNLEIAKNAILRNANNQFIADITGLTVEQVEQIRLAMNKIN